MAAEQALPVVAGCTIVNHPDSLRVELRIDLQLVQQGSTAERAWRGATHCRSRIEVVLAGSFTRRTTAVRGGALHADYGPLGSVSFRFV